jgi:hypothetical protein
LFSQGHGTDCTKEIGAELSLQPWSELSESAGAAGWEFEELADEEGGAKSDSSDDDFELRMDIDFSDEEMEQFGDASEDEEEGCERK